jgi:hypothetical protein
VSQFDSGPLIAAAAYPPQARSTHFASNLLEIFGGGLAQAFRLMLVADLLKRRHGAYQIWAALRLFSMSGP